jgi:HSP20 family protein
MAFELSPRRPFNRELAGFRGDMEEMMRRFFSEPLPLSRAEEWQPSVDIAEKDGNIVVKAELPGLEAKDIDLTVSGDLLTLKGEKKKEEETREQDYYRREIYAGSFQRIFRLPSEVDDEKVDASFKNGILTITMPKAESVSQKKIEIKTH